MKITLTEAVIALRAGVSTDGYTIKEEPAPIKDRIMAALKTHSMFAARADWELVVVVEDKNHCFVYSVRDESYVRVDYELDDNDVRITQIAPLKGEIPIREQFVMRAAVGLLTGKDLSAIESLAETEQEKSDAASRQRLEELKHLRLAGLIEDAEYNGRLLLETVGRKKQKQALLESDDPKAKRAALWEQYYVGKLTLDECLEHTAEIRLAEERGGRQLLTEQQHCGDDCSCDACHLEDYRALLDARVATGAMTRDEADRCFEIRCSL